MRQNGYLTVEASVVVTMVILIIASIIRFNFIINDYVVSDSVVILSGEQLRESKLYGCDIDTNEINLQKIVAAPILFGENEMYENDKKEIVERAQLLYDRSKVGNYVQYTETKPWEVIAAFDGPELIRAAGRMAHFIGGER